MSVWDRAGNAPSSSGKTLWERGQKPRRSGARGRKQSPSEQRLRDLGLLEGGGSGGFLNTLRHVTTQAPLDVFNAVQNSPRALFELDKGLAEDLAALAGKYSTDKNTRKKYRNYKFKTPALAGLYVTQLGQDVKHPLRHPGYTLLDALGVASLGAGSIARAGAVGRVARAADYRAIPRAAVKNPIPETPRVLRAKGVEVAVPWSKSPLTRAAQRHLDSLRTLFPDAAIGLQSHVSRVGKALEKQRRLEASIETLPAAELQLLAPKVLGRRREYSPKGVAMRAVLEGTPIESVIAKYGSDLRRARGQNDRASMARLRKHLNAAVNARKYVENDADGAPRIRPQFNDLAELTRKAETAALDHDAKLAALGIKTASELEAAIQKPARFIVGEDALRAGRAHVGYHRTKKQAKSDARMGVSGVVGIPKQPGRFRELGGYNLETGAFHQDVPNIIASNVIEGERFMATLRGRDFFLERAQDSPVGIPEKHAVAIRTDALHASDPYQPIQRSGGKVDTSTPEASVGMGSRPWPPEIRDILDRYANARQMDEASFNLMGLLFENFRKEIFPDIHPQTWQMHPEVKWIDGRLLGSLNKPNPLVGLLQYGGARKTLSVVDSINNAERAAILYLKPAYAVPNLVGNTFLTVTQQGWAAPFNISKGVRLNARMGPELGAAVDMAMGEGIANAIRAQGGLGKNAVNAMANVWQKVVDLPFRRAAFLYEARKAGFKTRAELHSLIHNPANREALYLVTEKATRALIDYSDLNRVERAIIRRIIFFYPWLKGSTKYAAWYLREHQIQAAILSQLGQRGTELNREELGVMPSWATGYFKVGGSDKQPYLVNPASAGVLSSPAQLAAIGANLLPGTQGKSGYRASGILTPFFDAVLTTLSGRNAFGTEKPRNLGTFGSELYESLPQVALYRRLTQDQRDRTFPFNDSEALLQFLLGGIAPKPANLDKLHESARRETVKPFTIYPSS